MEKDILSLRNIYRFLTVNDYPIYSTGVFKEENRKGLTLTKFWQENLLYEFRSGYFGKMIWRTSGGRNRHTSEMCNRSEVLKWYPQYTSELVSAINEKILIQQINQFKTCLLERKYDANVLEKKIKAAITMFYTHDICFGEEVADFFRKNLADGKAGFSKDAEARFFYAGWMLTFLSLHAMAGEEMNSVEMKRLRQNKAYALRTLWESLKEGNTTQKEEVHFLTNQNNALCITPLPMMRFFGREMELFDLRELLEQGGYYLLSGMGGIGKTELLRQLLHLCVEQGLMDEIAIIQYVGCLKDSCMNAFPNMHLVDGENALNEAMARIRMQEGKRVLTLVDNMNNSLEEDPELKQLLTLPGTVIMTSRLTSLEGFTTYEVKAPGRETGMLIFRDNYGKALSKDDKEELQELLEQEIWRHTLTLRLLGSTAKVRGWSVGRLKEKLEADGFQLLKERENREFSLSEMYRRMYDLSELEESQLRFLRCFAALPYQNYTEEFMTQFLQTYFSDRGDMQSQLKKLQECGWLNVTNQGYSLHPVIQECILFEPLVTEDILPFAKSIEAYWWKKCDSKEKSMEDWYLYTLGADAEDYRLLSIWENVMNELPGEIHRELISITIVAAMIDQYGNDKAYTRNLRKKLKELPKEIFEIDLAILLVSDEYDERKEYYMSVWQNRTKLGMSEWQQKLYAIELGNAMIKYNEPMACLELLEAFSQEESTGWMEAYVIGLACVTQTKVKEAYKVLHRSMEEMERTHFPNGLLKQMIFWELIQCCAEMGNYEETLNLIFQLEKLAKKQNVVYTQYLICTAKGVPCRNMGNLQEACEYQAEALRLARFLWGKNKEYAISCADLGMLLCKNGQIEEAEKYYLEAMPILTQDHEFAYMTSRAYNNMADMYIYWNKPEQAVECMQKSTEYGRDIQGIGLAERYRNFARAYRLAGDVEKEYENLKQAVPLLAEGYGPDHERTVAMRERLEEVERLMK